MKINYISALLVFLFGLFFSNTHAQTMYISNPSSSYTVLEGNTFTFNVNLYSISNVPTVVNVVTTDGTASASDYSSISTTVTIPAGQLSSSAILLPTANDATIENNESVVITGTVTSGNTTNTSATLPLTIIDNDTVPMLSSYSLNLYEGQNSTTTYINLSNPYSAPITFTLVSSNGTASASDYTTISTTITIPAGQTQTAVTLSTVNDALPEADETFFLTATVTSGNTANLTLTSTLTIIDNDTFPTVTLYTYSITEGQNGSFYISLDRPYNANVIINFTTTSGTAGVADYTPITTTKTITAGNTNTSVAIPITDDALDEPNENFTLTGTITSGNTTNTSVSALINIVDNDGLPDFYINSSVSPSTAQPLEEGQSANITVGLTYASPVDTVIQLTTANGTAGNADYTALNTTITIPAGQNYYYGPSPLLIPTILDTLQEGTETFSVIGTVTSGNTYDTTTSSTISILDNYNLNAQSDSVQSTVEVGTTFQVLANDSLHGLPLNFSDVFITLGTNTIGATLSAQGLLTIPSNLAMGYYQLSYTVCEIANPNSCDTGSISVQVKSPLQVTYNLTYSDYNSDGYTSVGDVITYQFNVTNTGNLPITNIEVDNAFSITVLGGPITSLGAGQTDSTTFTAIHIITQDDINFGFFQSNQNQLELSFKGIYYSYNVTGWAQQLTPFTLNTSDGIKLKAFIDSNANGIQDGTEINFPLGHFNYEINNNGTIHNIYSNPFYLYESNPATSYKLTYQVDGAYAAYNTCAVLYPSVSVAPASGITTYNFPITTTSYQDLAVNIHSYSAPPRPGFYYYNYIAYTNNSNQVIASGTVTFTKDSAVTITYNSSGAPNTASGFTLNFSDLQPFETRHIWLTMLVPTIPSVALGQLITNSVTINTPAGDILPLNNISSLTQTIVGSYDPNEKTESHGGKILQSGFTSNDYLTYTIQFENTGTANAININVSDMLDAKLDESTIRMVDASHEYVLERMGHNLTWKFSGINLPPSVPDTNTGHGYIVFQIKPKAGYTIGDVIPNTANIYFDFNPAIVTNTCTTEFVQSLNTNDFAFSNFKCYPNPVKNTLTITNATTIDTIEINSILGQSILIKKINNLQTEVDLTALSSGIYFIKASGNGQEKKVKIIKE